AAAQGEHQAELALSGWYLTGAEGILAQSDTEAYLWARKAAQAEPPGGKALFAMGYFSEMGIGCPASVEEARRWYGRAAAYKFPKALERLEELKKSGKSRVAPVNGKLARKDQKRDEAECAVIWHRVWTALFGVFSMLLHQGAAQLCGENVRHLLPLLQMTWNPQEKMSLSRILPLMTLGEASLPQDRLFAMFGLAERHGHRYLPPDYTLSVRDVSLIYTRAFIATDKRLAILSHVHPISGLDRLPTWALKLERTHLLKDSAEVVANQELLTESHQYNVTIQLASVVESAIRTATIVSTHIVEGTRTWSGLVDKIEQYCAIHLALPFRYPRAGERTVRALMRVLCRDESFFCSDAGPRSSGRWVERRRLHVAYMQHVTSASSESDQSAAGAVPGFLGEEELAEHVVGFGRTDERRATTVNIPEFPYNVIGRYLMQEMTECVKMSTRGMNLFVTAGGLLGIAARPCRVRDEVWLLSGANLPFVLRPQLNLRSKATPVTHQLIGDLFVRGVMHGEAMAGHQTRVSVYGAEGR
ncbi:hypothetical protein B0A55_04310, partial [Friedmanniomyces simplex]